MTAPFIRASELARIYGFTGRYWIKLAAQGRIPGARQPMGPRGDWLFDAAIFKAWWDQRLKEVPSWPSFTDAGASIGRGCNVRVESSGEASKQRIEQLLRSAFGSGSTT